MGEHPESARIRAMKSKWGRPAAWIHVLATSIWACWPAFLFYVLVLQPTTISLARLAVSALLVPALATLGYKTSLRFRLLSAAHWLRVLAASAAAAGLAVLILSINPGKTYLFYGPHTLRIQPVGISDEQAIELRWFNTMLGDVSFDTFQQDGDWQRSAGGLRLTADSEAPLIWRGFTGGRATLSFTGTPGVTLRVTWDGQPRDITFKETRARTVVETAFALPGWGYAGLSLLLFGTLLFAAVIIILNSQIAEPSATLPDWSGWLLLIGLFISLLLLASNVPTASIQLPLLIALTSLFAVPAWLLNEQLLSRAPWRAGIQHLAEVLRRRSTLLVLIGSAALAIGLFGRTVWMNWTMFDDHQIMQYVGPGYGLSFGQMWTNISKTEIGQFGNSLRFRPTYWFLRLLECVVWGARPYLWHAFRVLILAISLSLFWTAMTPALGWATAGLVCAYTLTFPYWNQLIAWLGPGETYAAAGLALYVWGMVRILHPPRDGTQPDIMAGAAVIVGSVLCIGSKENFVLLALPSAVLGCHALRHKDTVASAAALASILFAAYVGAGVLLAVTHQGVDIYSHSVSPADRIAHLLLSLEDARYGTPLLILAALAVAPAAGLLAPDLPKHTRSSILRAQCWLAGLCLIYLSQVLFYNGEWPTGSRYDFPGMLYIPAAIVILTVYGVQLAPEVNRATFSRTWHLALGITLALVTLMKGYSPTITFVDRMVKSSNEFVRGIEHAASTLRAHPDYALVIESGSVADYEAIFSHEEFLRAYGVQNSIFLRMHGYSLETALYKQETKLVAHLTDVSARGTSGFEPLDDFDGFGEKCFSLILSGDYETGCPPLK